MTEEYQTSLNLLQMTGCRMAARHVSGAVRQEPEQPRQRLHNPLPLNTPPH